MLKTRVSIRIDEQMKKDIEKIQKQLANNGFAASDSQVIRHLLYLGIKEFKGGN